MSKDRIKELYFAHLDQKLYVKQEWDKWSPKEHKTWVELVARGLSFKDVSEAMDGVKTEE